MTEKNKRKAELRARRKPPIPYTRATPTKKEQLARNERKHRQIEV